MPDQLHIFVSYARKDGSDLALRLRGDLIAHGYDVWLDTAEIEGGTSWSNISGATSTSYSDTTVSAGMAYSYRVRALSGTTPSAYSNVASASTTQSPPAAPSNLVAACRPCNSARGAHTRRGTGGGGSRRD